jgi:hypothetical protein
MMLAFKAQYMGANGKEKTMVFDYVLRKIGATELNSLIEVELDGDNIWLTMEDGSIKSIVVVPAGYNEELKQQYYGSDRGIDNTDGS